MLYLRYRLSRVLCLLERGLFVLFWGAVLFGFESPMLALMTLEAAALHELGHLLALWYIGGSCTDVRPRLRGLTMHIHRPLSYREEIGLAAAGPLANLLCALCCLAAPTAVAPFFRTWAFISLLSAVSNLLPVRGYDGARILSALLSLHAGPRMADRICRTVSFLLTVGLLFVFLFCILRLDAGYWAFAVCLLLTVGTIHTELRCTDATCPFTKNEKKRENESFCE